MWIKVKHYFILFTYDGQAATQLKEYFNPILSRHFRTFKSPDWISGVEKGETQHYRSRIRWVNWVLTGLWFYQTWCVGHRGSGKPVTLIYITSCCVFYPRNRCSYRIFIESFLCRHSYFHYVFLCVSKTCSSVISYSMIRIHSE